MKKLGKIQTLAIASLSALALAAPVAFAQSVKSDSDQPATGTNGGATRGFGHGHGEGHGRGMRGERGGGMFRGLNLTDAQKAQMKQIHESYRQRIAPLREQMRAQRQEARGVKNGDTFNEAEATQRMIAAAPLKAKLMGESFRLRQEMLAVLTPEQRTQMDQQRAARKARMEQMRATWGNNQPSGGDTAPQKQ